MIWRSTFAQGFFKIGLSIVANTIARRWCDIGRIDIANGCLNRYAATIVITVASHTVSAACHVSPSIGKRTIGRLTVSAITTVDTKLNPNVIVIIEENDNAGTTAESSFAMLL